MYMACTGVESNQMRTGWRGSGQKPAPFSEGPDIMQV